MVLILVVMEDALALLKKVAFIKTNSCLNPCCNGRCTRTGFRAGLTMQVLKSLNPCCNGRCTRTAKLGLCFV